MRLCSVFLAHLMARSFPCGVQDYTPATSFIFSILCYYLFVNIKISICLVSSGWETVGFELGSLR